MGLRENVFLGFVFLFLGGNLLLAAQPQFNLSSNETLNQTSAELVTTSSQLLPGSQQTADHQSNHSEQGDLAASPVSFRLRSYQLRSPAGSASKQKPLQPAVGQMQSLQGSERETLSSELRETRQAEEMLNLLPHGQDTILLLESKVLSEQRVPVSADSVSVQCGEGGVIIEVKQNFLGNGQLIYPSDLTLGGCPPVRWADRVLHFQTELQGCGSTIKMTEEALIYTFTLKYSPTPITNTFVLKTNPAEVGIQCLYQRRHHVSSGAMTPAWNQLSSNIHAEQQLQFSLNLMTEDWQSRRPSSVYFLSDVMHIEASVLQGHHAPLRVYVDSCVATATPNPYAQPRYSFVSDQGCLMDAKLTGGKSYFMQRSQEDKLQFQLRAFRFFHDDRNLVHITCHLKATLVSHPIDSQHKACSYLTEAKRWVASGGDNRVCSCCETTCKGQRLKRSLSADAAHLWEGTAALGPIRLEERIPHQEQAELSEMQRHEVTQAALFSSMALLGVGGAVVLLVYMGIVLCSCAHKPSEYSVSP